MPTESCYYIRRISIIYRPRVTRCNSWLYRLRLPYPLSEYGKDSSSRKRRCSKLRYLIEYLTVTIIFMHGEGVHVGTYEQELISNIFKLLDVEEYRDLEI